MSETRFVDEVEGLVALYEADVSVCVLRRAADADGERYVEEALVRRTFERMLRAPAARPERARELLPEGIEGPGRDAFLADLVHLVEIYAELLGPREVGLRLLSTDRAHCPRFHVDRIGVRMMCTYAGPGTEWVDGDAVDRRYLGPGAGDLPDESSGLLLDPSRIRRMDRRSVGLLKGDTWPRREGRGTVHRSPPPAAGEPNRVFFSVETLG